MTSKELNDLPFLTIKDGDKKNWLVYGSIKQIREISVKDRIEIYNSLKGKTKKVISGNTYLSLKSYCFSEKENQNNNLDILINKKV